MSKKDLLNSHLAILSDLVEEFTKERPVSQVIPAQELASILDVSLSKTGSGADTLRTFASLYLKHNPDVSQPAFFKLLYSGLNSPALLGDWVASLSNANMHTYQMSPVATLMELELIDQWNQLLGFENGDGVMVSGGSQANMVAMMLARHRKVGDCKKKGLQGKTLVAFVSDQAHYSSQRAANLLGIGTDNLIAVKSDEDGRLMPDDLHAKLEFIILEKGQTPFYIGLTSGTTVIGAFDPIKPCAELAQRYGCWLHVDGAWGAPVLFSKKHRHLMKDVHLADSASWDSHKLMSVPLTASGIQLREAGQLKDAISGGGGEYLFHQDENADFNLGERSLQCGRRADALKVWMSWKAAGNQGFAHKVEHLQALKEYCVEYIKVSDCFSLLAPTAYLNILFRYEPEESITEEESKRLNIAICTKLKKDGLAFIDYATYKGRTGIRLILGNGEAKEKDIDRVLKHCQNAGDFFSGKHSSF